MSEDNGMDRRKFIGKLGVAAAAMHLASRPTAEAASQSAPPPSTAL